MILRPRRFIRTVTPLPYTTLFRSCTKTASKLIRTDTVRHGLKELVRELLGQEVSKQQQSSDWGAAELSDAQRDYAASDVRFLHAMKEILDVRLAREGRSEEHTSELQSLMRISYAVFCLKKKQKQNTLYTINEEHTT